MLSVGLVFISDDQFHENKDNYGVAVSTNNDSLQLNYQSQQNFKFLDQRDRIQKKTFTKWMNQYLSKVGHRVDDLYEDLRDGVNLIVLLEILSGDKIVSMNNHRKDIQIKYNLSVNHLPSSILASSHDRHKII